MTPLDAQRLPIVQLRRYGDQLRLDALEGCIGIANATVKRDHGRIANDIGREMNSHFWPAMLAALMTPIGRIKIVATGCALIASGLMIGTTLSWMDRTALVARWCWASNLNGALVGVRCVMPSWPDRKRRAIRSCKRE